MSFFSGRYGWACDNVNIYEAGLYLLPFLVRTKTNTWLARSFLRTAQSTMSVTRRHTPTCTGRFVAGETTLASLRASISRHIRKAISGQAGRLFSTQMTRRLLSTMLSITSVSTLLQTRTRRLFLHTRMPSLKESMSLSQIFSMENQSPTPQSCKTLLRSPALWPIHLASLIRPI